MNSGVFEDSVSVIDEPALAPRLRFPPVRILLASGYYFPDDLLSWMYAGKSVRTTWRVDHARLHPFTKSGYRAALLAAAHLRKEMCPPAKLFVVRVVVTGDPDAPLEIIPAWRLEGPKPVPVKY